MQAPPLTVFRGLRPVYDLSVRAGVCMCVRVSYRPGDDDFSYLTNPSTTGAAGGGGSTGVDQCYAGGLRRQRKQLPERQARAAAEQVLRAVAAAAPQAQPAAGT